VGHSGSSFTPHLVLAETETSTFRFRGVGRTADEARAALLAGWDEHVREFTTDESGPDPDLMRDLIRTGDVVVTTFRAGQAYRDEHLLQPLPATS
jgi:hypothetical protein